MAKGTKSLNSSKSKQNSKKLRPILTPFMIFAGENRLRIWENNPNASYVSLGKYIVEEWEKLSNEEKKKYEEMSYEDSFRREKAKVATNPESEKKTTGKKQKKKRDPNAPKAASVSYMFFFKAMRPKVKQENTDASFGEIGKKIGAAWRVLTDEDKEPYEKMAKEDKLRYQDEINKYNEVRGDEFLQSELLEGTNPALFNDNIINTMNETLSVNTNKMQTTTNAPVNSTNTIESMSSGAGTNVTSSPEGVLSSVSNTMNSIDTTISNSNNNNVMNMSNALYTQ